MAGDVFDIEPGQKVAGALQVGDVVAPIADEALANGDVLVYDSSDGEFHPGSGGGGGVTSVTGTAPITSTGGTTPAIGITAATTMAAGSMSAADKTKLDALPSALSLPVSVANGGTGSGTGSAAGLNNIPASQLTGDVARARLTTALATGGDPVTGTVLTASTRTETPTIGTSSGAQHALPTGTAALLAADSSLPAANLTGDVARARMTTGLAAGGDPVTGTVLTASTRIDAPSAGTNSSNQHAFPSGTGALLDANSSLDPTKLSAAVAPNKGGTGASSLTAHGVVIGNGSSAVNVTSAGISGYVLTSNGAGADPTFQPASGTSPTATNAIVQSAGVSVSVDSTWVDVTNQAVTLPSAGTYLILAQVTIVGIMSAGTGYTLAQLYNFTDSADVPDSVWYTGTVFDYSTDETEITTCSHVILTVAASKQIRVQAQRFGGTWSSLDIFADGSRISYIKLSN